MLWHLKLFDIPPSTEDKSTICIVASLEPVAM